MNDSQQQPAPPFILEIQDFRAAPDEPVVAVAVGSDNRQATRRAHALIQAAPSLAEALQRFVEYYNDEVDDDETDRLENLINEAERALHSARYVDKGKTK